MALKMACADFTFPLLKHEDSLRLISMMGFDGVDIGLFEDRAHLYPSAVFQDIKKSAARLREKLEDVGLQPADIFLQTALDFVSLAPNHPQAAVREKARDLFLRTLEYTNEVGGKHVSTLPGVQFPSEERAASLGRCCEELAWRCRRAEESGLVFSVEAHLGSIATTPAQVLEMVEAVPGLTLTLDYTHFAKQGISDKAVHPLLKYASHFHARGAAPGRLQTIVSESSIDYTVITKTLKKLDYQGFMGIEYTWQEWEDCNRVDNVSESILLKKLIQETWNSDSL